MPCVDRIYEIAMSARMTFRATKLWMVCIALAIGVCLRPAPVDAGDVAFHKNHVSLFLGGVTPLSMKHETSFSIGVAYKRRFLKWIGLEVGGDLNIGKIERAALFAVGPVFHPVAGLKLAAGVGFEVVGGTKRAGDRVDAIITLGAGYDLEVGPISLTPEFYFDFIGKSKTNITYGLTVGYGF